MHLFGSFASEIDSFKFTTGERSLILSLPTCLKQKSELGPNTKSEIALQAKHIGHWFDESSEPQQNNILKAPAGAQNLLGKMLEASEMNSMRPKHGYRYGDDLKKMAVYHRTLAGPMAYKSIQLNLEGCFPSISTTNRYIHRSDHAVVEGVLRCDELLVYLKERNLPLWVCLSEDATSIENRIQYDARTNQIIGFVLPTSESNGMPVPLVFKARTAIEILRHFSDKNPVAKYVNTVMAQPIGDAPAFCIIVFGTINDYTAENVSKRWIYMEGELAKVGIGVLTMASDSDPKYSSAMMKNSGLGNSSNGFSMNGIFMCGNQLKPPFYVQDTPHVGTKMRNFFLQTIKNPQKLRMGNYYIQQGHLNELMNMFPKDIHHLTATALNPVDRMNFDSVLKICDDRVISLLRNDVKDSEATVIYLQMMSDVINAFMDRSLLPSDRLRKVWNAVFLVRIWRNFVLDQPGLTIKDNFLSTYTYRCIELNAHSLTLISVFLKEEKLTHLFVPHMFSSQPCESFYRQLRSLTTVNSTVTNCSTKEILNRISRIQILNEISNDKESGFLFPKPLKSSNSFYKTYVNVQFPTRSQIYDIIQGCKKTAIETAKRIGLIKKNVKAKDSMFSCQLLPYIFRSKKWEDVVEENLDVEPDIEELELKLMTAHLKNYSDEVKENHVSENSSYVEMYDVERRLVFKKNSICWLFRKESYKCSSDRILRVRGPKKDVTKKIRKLKTFKPCKKTSNKKKK